ncbi:CbtB-domain containing protein [Nocardia cyriacigeorgica]|uniref:CbtB domain-containing protein n=1 Tax=Nocardia cyriacigeorgica TaxID=135487 RepID=UPI0018952FD4|nr:CbtB domain-containing protein [Nocardia cyriacigeorgica]MBF6099498.1 CbtB-domain containing protein [Nocardia cyriacigeorgica]MBF6343325.1 CbtB-domain containing protein [Nocardia cyriacigeorgica]
MAFVHTPGVSARATDSLATVLITVGVVLLALLTIYLVGFDQGAISRSGMFMHELMHDGRHLLGLPCH